jgi:predicted NUDIX family NTP pyrophosphohydrolase
VLFRRAEGAPEVLLVHPGGPFWARRDAGAWSIPKGEYEPGDDPFQAARREFEEELSSPPPAGEAVDLGEVKQRGGKLVCAWAIEGDLDPSDIKSNTFAVEWPPRSGRMRSFPEVDRAEWFTLRDAREKINPAQSALLDRLVEQL